MRITARFLVITSIVLGLCASAGAQVHMKLGGPSGTTVQNPTLEQGRSRHVRIQSQFQNSVDARLTSYQNPIPNIDGVPSIPEGNMQAPTLLPTLGTPVESSETSQRVPGEMITPPAQPETVLHFSDPVQPSEITYPDPVTIAPESVHAPAPIAESDLFGPVTQAPPQQLGQPVYQGYQDVQSGPVVMDNFESYPVEGDYQNVVDDGSTGMMISDSGCGCGSGAGSNCGCDGASGIGVGRASLLGQGKSRRVDRRGRRVTRRNGRRDGRGGCLLGSCGPAYMFVDFGGYFGDGTARLEDDGLTFSQTSNIFSHTNNLLFGAGVGRYLTNNLRVDLSGRYRFAEIDSEPLADTFGGTQQLDGGTELFTTMLTGRYNVPGFRGCIKPYFSAGIGLAYGRSHATATSIGPAFFALPFANTDGFPSNESTTLAYALGGGVSFKMTERMYFDLDYQWIDFGQDRVTNSSLGSGSSVRFEDLDAHEVAFRLRFNF